MWRRVLLGLALAAAAAVPRRAAAQGLGITVEPRDLTILTVEPRSAAWRGGMKAGDRLREIGGRTVRSVADVQRVTASMRGPTPFIVQRGARRLQGAVTLAGPSVAAGWDGACRPGQHVEVVDSGKWHRAVIVAVRNDGYSPCRVHWIGYETTLDEWVQMSMLRPVGAGEVQPIPGGANAYDATLDSIRRGGAPAPVASRVAAGHYDCVAFVTNHLVHTGELTITGPGTYRSGDSNGTYTIDGAGLVRFRGSAFDGQSADYENRARPVFHVRGPSGRQVMDCDGPAR